MFPLSSSVSGENRRLRLAENVVGIDHDTMVDRIVSWPVFGSGLLQVALHDAPDPHSSHIGLIFAPGGEDARERKALIRVKRQCKIRRSIGDERT